MVKDIVEAFLFKKDAGNSRMYIESNGRYYGAYGSMSYYNLNQFPFIGTGSRSGKTYAFREYTTNGLFYSYQTVIAFHWRGIIYAIDHSTLLYSRYTTSTAQWLMLRVTNHYLRGINEGEPVLYKGKRFRKYVIVPQSMPMDNKSDRMEIVNWYKGVADAKPKTIYSLDEILDTLRRDNRSNLIKLWKIRMRKIMRNEREHVNQAIKSLLNDVKLHEFEHRVKHVIPWWSPDVVYDSCPACKVDGVDQLCTKCRDIIANMDVSEISNDLTFDSDRRMIRFGKVSYNFHPDDFDSSLCDIHLHKNEVYTDSSIRCYSCDYKLLFKSFFVPKLATYTHTYDYNGDRSIRGMIYNPFNSLFDDWITDHKYTFCSRLCAKKYLKGLK